MTAPRQGPEGLPPAILSMISPVKRLLPAVCTMAASGQMSLQPVSPLDIVFSCCVCTKTLAEVYGDQGREIGLHQEPTTATGRITKLYLTGCAHVVCAEHLEGGGKCAAVNHLLLHFTLQPG